MGAFLSELKESIFPHNFTCDICGRETFDDANLCPSCAKTVTLNDGATCPVCGRKTKSDGLCLECKAHAPAFDRAVSALVYKDGGAALVMKFKRGGAYLKNYFADLLAPKCRTFEGADAVCFIPMTAKAERKRGYNQAELLAKELARRLNLPLVRVLEKVKDTAEQKSLTKKERESNLKGCFSAHKRDVEGKSFIVADDVMTTGATAEEAAHLLKRKGAAHVYFAAAASVEYDNPL